RGRHTRFSRDWSSDVCSSDLMRAGALLRFEEITRCVPDVQDALVSVLSDKAIAVPELPASPLLWARPGFNVIATANSRDQGVNRSEERRVGRESTPGRGQRHA